MDTISEKMFNILRLDPSATLKLSTSTGQWYVTSHLAIGDGSLVGGITEHHETPDRAVSAFWARLIAHGPDEYVTNGRSGDERRNWRWSGVMFREVSTDSLRRQYAAHA